jgi:hypothetical protein
MSRADAAAAAARRARLTALTVGLAVLLLVGAFVLMVIFVQDEVPLNAAGPVSPTEGYDRGGLVFIGTINVWEVRGRMLEDSSGQVAFVFDLTGPSGQPAPDMLDMQLYLAAPGAEPPGQPLRWAALGSGRYTAGAQLPVAGRWEFRIAFPGIAGVFAFAGGPAGNGS